MSIVPRRNSLGDLKNIREDQPGTVGLKRDLSMIVREFATHIEGKFRNYSALMMASS
jgi:hypothetical protein